MTASLPARRAGVHCGAGAAPPTLLRRRHQPEAGVHLRRWSLCLCLSVCVCLCVCVCDVRGRAHACALCCAW